DHLDGELQGAARLDPLEDAQGTVVERRVAPDEEGAGAGLVQLIAEQRLVDPGDGLVPVLDAAAVAAGGIALRHGEGDPAHARPLDEAVADPPPQVRELLLLLSLLGNEDHIDPVERLDGCNRHVLRIAGADADDENVALHDGLRHGWMGLNGLRMRAPRPSTSAPLRVTRVRPLTLAVAASRPSTTGTGRMALIRPHSCETALSMRRMRPSKASSMSPSHRSRAAALSGSRWRRRSMPLRISPITSVLRNKSS